MTIKLTILGPGGNWLQARDHHAIGQDVPVPHFRRSPEGEGGSEAEPSSVFSIHCNSGQTHDNLVAALAGTGIAKFYQQSDRLTLLWDQPLNDQMLAALRKVCDVTDLRPAPVVVRRHYKFYQPPT